MRMIPKDFCKLVAWHVEFQTDFVEIQAIHQQLKN